jgi:hypothetical protein
MINIKSNINFAEQLSNKYCFERSLYQRKFTRYLLYPTRFAFYFTFTNNNYLKELQVTIYSLSLKNDGLFATIEKFSAFSELIKFDLSSITLSLFNNFTHFYFKCFFVKMA